MEFLQIKQSHTVSLHFIQHAHWLMKVDNILLDTDTILLCSNNFSRKIFQLWSIFVVDDQLQAISELKWVFLKEISQNRLCAGVCLLLPAREAVPQPVHHSERWPETNMKVLLSVLVFKVLIVTFLSRLQSFFSHGVPWQLKASENSGSRILGGFQTSSSVPKESLGEAGPS